MKNERTYIYKLLRALASDNSEQALKSLFLAYSDSVLRYARLYVKSFETAEELVADVFLSVWEQRATAAGILDFDAYLFTIAKFKIMNHLREKRPEEIDLDDVSMNLFACTVTTPEDEFISNELMEAANRAVEKLPPKAKLAFKLVREDGLKYKEAAACMGISIKTLEGHLTAAMKAIAQTLGVRR
ncbi:MAG: sigma-70 family RNA polymerase sigma factor [Tannerellaceae bacterium]|jgi:RNA polymerase sigma-70 factor (ECF subfamily)|nr:sigma-70 family RNA polymerase sigma factor [Tannerellaceae bacterium]